MERFETKYDLLNRVYEDTRLKRTTKALMQYLVAKSDERSCHSSVAAIAKAIRMSERTVQRHMRELEEYGYLVRKARFYRQEQLTNQYEFVLDVMDTHEPQLKRENKSSYPAGISFKESIPDTQKEIPFHKIEYIKSIAGTGLSNKECLVLIYLVHKANQKGITYGSIKAASRNLHISRRLLWKIILELRIKGCLLLKKNKGRFVVKLMPFSSCSIQQEEKKEQGELLEERRAKQVDAMVKSEVFRIMQSEYGRKEPVHQKGGILRFLKERVVKFREWVRHFLS